MKLHIYHHYQNDETPLWAKHLSMKMSLILENQGKIMSSFDDLKASLDAVTTDVTAIQTGVTNLQTQITTLTTELAAAGTTLPAAAQTALDAANVEAASIKTNMDALAAAVAPPSPPGPTT